MPSSDHCSSTINYVFRYKDKLGSGSSCDVFRGIEKISGHERALKVFKDEYWSNSQERTREIEALTSLSHTNIVQFYGKEQEAQTGRGVLVMEHCSGGSLHSYLQEPENIHGLGDSDCRTFLADMCAGLGHLRNSGFVHRDIKPGNILIHTQDDGHMIFKLADFGASRRVEDDLGQFTSLAGTEEYLHPAMFQKAFINRGGSTVFNECTDLWSLGVTIYQACTGHIPFKPYGGVRSNRAAMFMLITEKPSGAISGVQPGPDEDIVWSTTLPNTCKLSQVLREVVTRMVSGLVEYEESRQWTFPTFQHEVKMLSRQKPLILVNTHDANTVTFYVSENPSLSEIQEGVARLTDVPAHRQILLYRDLPLDKLANSHGHVSCLTSDPEEALIMVCKDEPEDESMSRRSVGKCPEFKNAMSLEDDAKSAVLSCSFIHEMLVMAQMSLSVSRGQRRAEMTLWSALRLVLLKIEKKYRWITDMYREKQNRLEMMREFESTRKQISNEENDFINRGLKNARSQAIQICQNLSKVKPKLSQLMRNIVKCDEELMQLSTYACQRTQTSVNTLKRNLEDGKAGWRWMRAHRRHPTLREHETVLYNKHRRDIQTLSSSSQTLWTRDCLPERIQANSAFLESKSKYLQFAGDLEDIERSLHQTNRTLDQLSAQLTEIWAFTGQAWKDIKQTVSSHYEKSSSVHSLSSSSSSSSSGYSSMNLITENSQTSNSLRSLVDDLPVLEILNLEEISSLTITQGDS